MNIIIRTRVSRRELSYIGHICLTQVVVFPADAERDPNFVPVLGLLLGLFITEVQDLCDVLHYIYLRQMQM
jgi:hypothetical protein